VGRKPCVPKPLLTRTQSIFKGVRTLLGLAESARYR
jgi:hypothetical protein